MAKQLRPPAASPKKSIGKRENKQQQQKQNKKNKPPSHKIKPTTTKKKTHDVWKLRLITLLALLLVDGTYSLFRRYSQGILKEAFSTNEVLFVSELYKITFSTYMIMKERGDTTRIPLAHLVHLVQKSSKMLLLAVLYGIMNALSYVALKRIGGGTFVIIAQMKTLTTAIFSSIILERKYSTTKWRALILLVTGVILFVLPTISTESEVNTTTTSYDIFIGVIAEIVAVTMSGFASIYFEKVIKGGGEKKPVTNNNNAPLLSKKKDVESNHSSQEEEEESEHDNSDNTDIESTKGHQQLSIWERNVQLGVCSLPLYIIMMVVYPRPENSDGTPVPYFHGWTSLAFLLSLLGASGGLLVALSIKYGDSVLKTLAISGSIIYVAIVDHYVLGGPLNFEMVLSAIVVIVAVFNYTFDATPA